MPEATVVAWILFGGLALLILVRVPLGFALAVSTATAYWYTGDSFVSLAQSFYDSVDSFPLVAVPMFFLAGSLMEVGGISRRLVSVAEAAVGSIRGGLGIVSILASMFFSAISGSGPATTAAVGGIMVPAMLQRNYPPALAGAIVASGGTLGVLIPPSILLILFGVIADESISRLFLAALLPGIFIGVFLMGVVYLVCLFTAGITQTSDTLNMRRLMHTCWEAKLSLLVPVIILGGIYSGAFTATESAVVAVFYGFFVSMFIYRELTWKQVLGAVTSATKVTGKLGIIWGVSVAYGEVMTIYQLPSMLSETVLGITTNPVLILFMISAFLVVTGCLMNSMSQVIIFTPIYLPVIKAAGIDPIHFCMVFIINAEIGFLTPPLGTNLFVAMEQANCTLGEISRAVIPFILAFFVINAIIILFPQLSLSLPNILM